MIKRVSGMKPEEAAAFRRFADWQIQLVRRMNEEHVGLLAGTDVATDWTVPGFSLHDELSAFVDRVLAATGAKKVDIVGHSEGATMPDYYIEYLGGAAKVARYVGVSGVKHGTTLHGVGTLLAEYATLFPGTPMPTIGSCASCPQFLVGSDYIKKIEARAPVPSVTYTNIATRYDELVSPHTSSFLTGPNVTGRIH